MDALATVIRYEMLFLLIILILIIAYKLLHDQINTTGLLLDKTSGTGDRAPFSPGRLQMLIVTLSIAIYYVLTVIETKDTGRLPDMPKEFLIALGGSHTIYLGGKIYGMIANQLAIRFPAIEEEVQNTKRRMEK
jgi:hypothetical protein